MRETASRTIAATPGVIDIDDDGETVGVQLTGKNWKGEVLFSETLRFPD